MMEQPNNSKNSNNFTSPSNEDYNHVPFRIMTLNVQGFNTTKQNFIPEMMKYNNIQILGISETNLKKKQAKLVYNNNRQYKGFFTTDKDGVRGSGVGIIMERQY